MSVAVPYLSKFEALRQYISPSTSMWVCQEEIYLLFVSLMYD